MGGLGSQLNGTVNVYTMDHRGTGRSEYFDCVATQAITTGSPDRSDTDPTEVTAAVQALEIKYGNLATFSTTSALTDLETLTSKFPIGACSIAYGGSYGSALDEYLMHLQPPEVTEYVLDGIATTSRPPLGVFEHCPTCDEGIGKVGDYF